jgi:hypothetical protein
MKAADGAQVQRLLEALGWTSGHDATIDIRQVPDIADDGEQALIYLAEIVRDQRHRRFTVLLCGDGPVWEKLYAIGTLNDPRIDFAESGC